MAIIKSGFLFGLYRSASGMTFYKRQGTNSVRSKPVRSLDWEPSGLQRFYQEVFSAINDFVKSDQVISALVDGGWGWSRRDNSSSNLNNIIGYIFRSITRNEGGERRSQPEIEAVFSNFLSYPLQFFLERCQMVATEYPLVSGVQTELSKGNTLRISMRKSDVDEWRRKVERMQGRFRVNSPVFIFVGASQGLYGPQPNIVIERVTLQNGFYTITIPASVVSSSIWQVCLAVNDDANATAEYRSGFAISPAVASSVLRGDIPDIITPTVSGLTANGFDRPFDKICLIQAGQIVNISGTVLQASKLFMRLQSYATNEISVQRLGAVGTVTVDTPELISLTLPSKSTGYRVSTIQLADGTILAEWPIL